MATIHKYSIPQVFGQPFVVETHAGAEPLAVGCQGNDVVMWMRVDTSRPVVQRMFQTAATDAYCPPADRATYVGTAQAPDGSVWHVFSL